VVVTIAEPVPRMAPHHIVVKPVTLSTYRGQTGDLEHELACGLTRRAADEEPATGDSVERLHLITFGRGEEDACAGSGRAPITIERIENASSS
jgi:hypothetical protein